MPYARRYTSTSSQRRSRGPARSKRSTAVSKIQKKFRSYRKRRVAPRYSGVRAPARQSIKRKIVSALNDIAETQFISTKLVSIPPRTLAYNITNAVVHYNLGSTSMTNINTGLPAGGHLDQFNLGITSRLVGKAAYLKSNTHIFQIRMKPFTDATFTSQYLSAIHFRVLILANRTRLHTENNPPMENCFLGYANQVFGYDSNGLVDNMAIKTALINKKDFVVLRDTQFQLNPPSFAQYRNIPGNPDDMTYSSSGLGNNKPSVKMIRHTTPINKKCDYNPSLTSGPPMNLADDVYIVVLATSATGVAATGWELDLQSTTSYTDM